MPSTFGHEFASEVVEVGKNVTKFKVGDRVVGANTAPCFECENCKNKRYSLCTNLQYLNGAYSEYVAVPSHILKYNFYKIPDHLPYEQAALLEPLACAVHGVDRIPAKVGDKVAVIGAGPIGLMFMNLLVLKGCQVIAVDLSDYRLNIAKEKFGVYETVNAKEDSHIQEVRISAADQEQMWWSKQPVFQTSGKMPSIWYGREEPCWPLEEPKQEQPSQWTARNSITRKLH